VSFVAPGVHAAFKTQTATNDLLGAGTQEKSLHMSKKSEDWLGDTLRV